MARDLSLGMDEKGGFITPELYSPEDLGKKAEDLARGAEIGAALMTIKINTPTVNREKYRIEFLENVVSVAPRVLEGEEAEKTLRMLEAFEIGNVLMGVSETGRRSWEVEGLVYALDPDGTLTVGEAGVPTSEEERLDWLNSSKERYASAQGGFQQAEEKLANLLQERRDVLAY
ncbi:MAG: hypothetical protein ABJQ71_12885 [Roseibium sp.]